MDKRFVVDFDKFSFAVESRGEKPGGQGVPTFLFRIRTDAGVLVRETQMPCAKLRELVAGLQEMLGDGQAVSSPGKIICALGRNTIEFADTGARINPIGDPLFNYRILDEDELSLLSGVVSREQLGILVRQVSQLRERGKEIPRHEALAKLEARLREVGITLAQLETAVAARDLYGNAKCGGLHGWPSEFIAKMATWAAMPVFVREALGLPAGKPPGFTHLEVNLHPDVSAGPPAGAAELRKLLQEDPSFISDLCDEELDDMVYLGAELCRRYSLEVCRENLKELCGACIPAVRRMRLLADTEEIFRGTAVPAPLRNLHVLRLRIAESRLPLREFKAWLVVKKRLAPGGILSDLGVREIAGMLLGWDTTVREVRDHLQEIQGDSSHA